MIIKNCKETLFALWSGELFRGDPVYAFVTREWTPTDPVPRPTVKFYDVVVDLSPMDEQERVAKEKDMEEVYCWRGEIKQWMKLGSEADGQYAEMVCFEFFLGADQSCLYQVSIAVHFAQTEDNRRRSDETLCFDAIPLARRLLLAGFPGAVLFFPSGTASVELSVMSAKVRDDAEYSRTTHGVVLRGEAFVEVDNYGDERACVWRNDIRVSMMSVDKDADLPSNLLGDAEEWVLDCRCRLVGQEVRNVYYIKQKTISDAAAKFLGERAFMSPDSGARYFDFFLLLIQRIEEHLSKRH